MSSNRLTNLVGGFVFLLLAFVALYRLLWGFSITVGGLEVGQTASFFALVNFAALSPALF